MTRTEAYERATTLQLGLIDYEKHPEKCWEGVRAHHLFISVVKNPSEELCREALKQCGRMIRFVPEKFYTPENLKLAIQTSYEVVEIVPSKYLTEEVCLEYIRVHKDLFRIQNIISPDMDTKRLYEEAVRLNLEYITNTFPESIDSLE